MFKFKMLYCIVIIYAAFSGIYCYTDAPDKTPMLYIYKGENFNWLSKEYDFNINCWCRLDRGRVSVTITSKNWEAVVRKGSVSTQQYRNPSLPPKYQCDVNISKVDDTSDGVMICNIYDRKHHFEERVRLVLQERGRGAKESSYSDVSDEKWHRTESLDPINNEPTSKSVSPKRDDTRSNKIPKHVTVTSLNPNVTETKWVEPQVKYLPLGKPWTWTFNEMENIASCECYILNAKGTRVDFGAVKIKTRFVNEIKKDICELTVPEVNEQMDGLVRCNIVTMAGVHTIEEALFSAQNSAANTKSNGWMVAAWILIVALLVVTGILLWLLLRKRCRTMWSPKEHKEQLLNEVVTGQSQDSTGKYEETKDDTSNRATYAITTPPKPEVKPAIGHNPNITDKKPAEPRLQKPTTPTPTTERKLSTADNLDENKTVETPRPMTEAVERNGFQMPLAAVTTYNAMGQDNSPESPAKPFSVSGDQNQEPLKTPETKNPDSYQLNMIKNCFGEALTRMNQKKPLIPKKPSRKSLKGASSTENLKDYDKPANIVRAVVGEPDKAQSSEASGRPKSAMTQNDLYVSANADEEYDKPASILRAVLDVGPKTPLIRPPTAFITEDDLKGGREEYENPRSIVRPPISSPKLKSSKEATLDNESDTETDDLYDSPSCVLRKLSYPRTQ